MAKKKPNSSNYAQANLRKLEQEVIIAPIGRGSSDRLRGENVGLNARRSALANKLSTAIGIEDIAIQKSRQHNQRWIGKKNEDGSLVLPSSLEEFRTPLENPRQHFRDIVQAMIVSEENNCRFSNTPVKLFQDYINAQIYAWEEGLLRL